MRSIGRNVFVVLTSTLLAIALWSRPASAGTVYFDPAGQHGAAVAFASLDWDVANTLAVGALPATAGGHDFVEYYQARLANFKDARGNPIINTGLNVDYELTIVAGYTLTGSRVLNTGSMTVDAKDMAATQTVNSFTVYLDHSRNANDLAGTGFADGTPIMQGTIDWAGGQFMAYAPVGSLDGFSRTSNSWSGTQSTSGTGSIDLEVAVSSVNGAFVHAAGPIVSGQLGGEQSLPYTETVPGLAFGGYIPNVGATNGISGPDMLLQTDSNMALVVSIPQPKAVGAGLIALAAMAALRKWRGSAR